jgi:hypothetical protein
MYAKPHQFGYAVMFSDGLPIIDALSVAENGLA